MDEGQVTVLLVEDNTADVVLLREMLAGGGIDSFVAEDVPRLATGITRLTEQPYDVVLLDLSLPDSQGLDTYDRLHEQAPDVPVVVMTGTRDQDLAVEAVHRGAQDYLVKGEVDADGLRRCLRYALERMRLRRRLKDYLWKTEASEGRLRRIIEHSADGVVITDQDRTVLYVNSTAEELLGQRAEDLVGAPLGFALPEGGQAEVKVVTETGDVVVVEIGTSETTWDGRAAWVAALRDITERSQAEELQGRLAVEELRVRHLEEVNRLRTLFTQTVSHELRTPLTPLKTAVAMLLDGAIGEVTSEQRKALQMMDRNITRLSRITGDVLDVSSSTDGEEDVRARTLPLEGTLRPTVELLQAKAGVRDVRLEMSVDRDVLARADADTLCQVVALLLDASITHCPSGTQIRLSTRPIADRMVEVRIDDDGRGRTAESMMRDGDFSLDEDTEAGHSGMLFGLALCRSLVEGMGGALSFESRPGEGTTFRFSLPTAGPNG